MSKNPYDCASCGACCNVFVVDVAAHEADWIPDEHLSIHPKHGTYRLAIVSEEHVEHLRLPYSQRCIGGTCSAWEGKLGDSSRCTIYLTRPDACQNYGLSKADCDRARTRAKLPVIELNKRRKIGDMREARA